MTTPNGSPGRAADDIVRRAGRSWSSARISGASRWEASSNQENATSLIEVEGGATFNWTSSHEFMTMLNPIISVSDDIGTVPGQFVTGPRFYTGYVDCLRDHRLAGMPGAPLPGRMGHFHHSPGRAGWTWESGGAFLPLPSSLAG